MEIVPCTPEICSKSCEQCNKLQEGLDMMCLEMETLEDRLHQIKSISLTARRSLQETLACECCSETVLNGVFSAIEIIAEYRWD